MQNKTLTLLLLLCTFGFSQFNEMKPIPAFYVNSTNAEDLIQKLKSNHFLPILISDYQYGLTDVQKHNTPFILITGNQKLVKIVNAYENSNLPAYHEDYDPVEKIKAYALTSANLSTWVSVNKKTDFYISDGISNNIFLNEEGLQKLFLYAPAKNLQIEFPKNVPFLTQKTTYPTKEERMKTKKPTLRGLHMTWDGVNSTSKSSELIAKMKEQRMETVVIDFKSYFYLILNKYSSFKSLMEEDNEKLLTQAKELQNMTKYFQSNGIKVSYRIVIAMDFWAERMNTDLLLWNKSTNTVWKDNNKQPWLDFFAPETIKYYKKLFQIMASMKPDEIQLDYVRYPSEGQVEVAISRTGGNKPHYKGIEGLMKEMVKITDQNNIAFAADIFGIVLWENQATNDQLGQNILTFMRYTDEICPMIYPSHFHKGFDGTPFPGDAPYLFIKKGSEKFRKLTEQYPNYKVLMIPWIQAFQYLAPSYSPEYIKEEIRACVETKMDGFLAWNAANNYTVFFKGTKISTY